ncbi:hypothetical protein NKI11_30740 [Mesorhizobium sp. M0684]
MLRDNDLGAAVVQIGDDGVAVESLVGDQPAEGEAVDERRNAYRIETMAGQENEAHEIAERISERENLGGHAARAHGKPVAGSSGFLRGKSIDPGRSGSDNRRFIEAVLWTPAMRFHLRPFGPHRSLQISTFGLFVIQASDGTICAD